MHVIYLSADCRPVDVDDDGLVSQTSAVTAANNSEYSVNFFSDIGFIKEIHICHEL